MTEAIECKLVELRKWIPRSEPERLVNETINLYRRRPDLFEEYICFLIDEFKRTLQQGA
jgi:hypothetical protein